MNKILKAARFAAQKHKAQKRKDPSGTPYINHPIEVAGHLSKIGGVEEELILIAALLHDTIEDTDTSAEEIKKEFSEEVMKLVLECSDDKSLEKQERKRLQIVNAAGKSNAAKMLKVADTTCNLQSILEAAPVGWTVSRQLAYFEWAGKVFAGLKGVNAGLDEEMEKVLELGLQIFKGEKVSVFDNVPVEPETRILRHEEFTIQGIPVRQEQWGWDGVYAASLIFMSKDVAHLSDDEILAFVNKNCKGKIDEKVTFTRDKDGYCFVNYNFYQGP